MLPRGILQQKKLISAFHSTSNMHTRDTFRTLENTLKESFANVHFFSDNQGLQTLPTTLMTLSLSRHPTWFNLFARAYCLSDRKKSKIKASKKIFEQNQEN